MLEIDYAVKDMLDQATETLVITGNMKMLAIQTLKTL